MPSKNHDLHGNAPDRSGLALVLIDVINDLEFDGGEQLLEKALPAAECIAELKRRAKELEIPVIYANDNFGRWRSDFREVIDHCRRDGVRGAPLADILEPDPDDYFVLKPKHSAFFSTTMDTLLEYLGAKSLILTGLTGDICVLFTAADAYMRDFQLYAPRDCVASIEEANNEQALDYMQRVLKVDVSVSGELDLRRLRDEASAEDETDTHDAHAVAPR